jgi:fatty-acyl-CoA synthase
MAATISNGNLDLDALRGHLAAWLPPYARPLFLRVADRLEATATFKHTKTNLQREGFDPAATSDAIYFDDPAKKAFVRLDAALFARITAGKVRL